MTWTNADADWDRWPVDHYLAENYRQVHDCDSAVIDHHAAYYRTLEPASIDGSLEFGGGPNLYPLMLASAVSRSIHVIESSAANVAYLEGQLTRGPDDSWAAFYDRCRARDPRLPTDIRRALRCVSVERGDARRAHPGAYGLASMNFVAESVSEDLAEVAEFCAAFVASVRVGGHLVAAFMENMGRYALGDGSQWPGCPVGAEDLERIFAPRVTDLTITRIDADPGLPDYGYTGMVMLTARRA